MTSEEEFEALKREALALEVLDHNAFTKSGVFLDYLDRAYRMGFDHGRD